MLNMILITTGAVFDMFILFIYFSRMLGKKKSSINFIIYYSSFILMELILTLNMYILNEVHTIIRFFSNMLLSIGTLYILTLLYDAKIRHRLFVSISFQIHCTLSEIIAYTGLDMIEPLISDSIPINDYIYNFMSKIILLVIVLVTILITTNKKNNYNIQYNIMILLTPILSMLFLVNMSPYFGLYSQTDKNSITYAIHIISLIGLAILNIVNYYLLNYIIESIVLKEKEKLLISQIQNQSEKYDMISASYRDTRRLIHDTKKHYFFIRSAAENGQCGEIIKSVNEELDSLEIKHIPVNSGNLVIDSLVGNYIQLARQEGIAFKTSIHITPQLVPVKDYNLCVLIGNLLENSINACRKINKLSDRHITFETYTSEKDFIIHVSNSISDKQLENKTSDSINHGYGMLNIENIVNDYYGIYTHEIKNGEFSSIIVIPIRINMEH